MKEISNRVCLTEFGTWIESARKRKCLSQIEVASAAGLSQSQYCRIESAKREVDLCTAMRVCQVLELDLSDFIKKYM